MSLNFGPTVNARLIALAGLSAEAIDASTLEIVAIDPAVQQTVVRGTVTATIPTPDLIGALIAYFSPPGSTSVTAAVVVHGDGTVKVPDWTATRSWAALTSGGVELSGGLYARQPVTWVVNGTTATAQVAFNVPVGSTVDGVAFEATQTGTLGAPLTVVSQPFTTGGVYTAAFTFDET